MSEEPTNDEQSELPPLPLPQLPYAWKLWLLARLPFWMAAIIVGTLQMLLAVALVALVLIIIAIALGATMVLGALINQPLQALTAQHGWLPVIVGLLLIGILFLVWFAALIDASEKLPKREKKQDEQTEEAEATARLELPETVSSDEPTMADIYDVEQSESGRRQV